MTEQEVRDEIERIRRTHKNPEDPWFDEMIEKHGQAKALDLFQLVEAVKKPLTTKN